jgi:thymidylate kinase
VWFTGLSGAGKMTICKSVHAEFQAAEFQDNPQESARCPTGQTARPEAAARNWISA